MYNNEHIQWQQPIYFTDKLFLVIRLIGMNS